MSKLELTKSAINNLGYVDIDRKNLEAIEAEIRADERKKVVNKIRELKQHTGKNHFCTKEYCPYREDVDCHDCMDAILNYVERGGKTE